MNEISIFVLLHNTTLCNVGPVHNTRLDNTYGFERRFPSYTHVTHSLAIASFVSGKTATGEIRGSIFSSYHRAFHRKQRKFFHSLLTHRTKDTHTSASGVLHLSELFLSDIYEEQTTHKKMYSMLIIERNFLCPGNCHRPFIFTFEENTQSEWRFMP